ncbi:MAG: FecR domain-containing protein [SAR324 cluster bacterium]|nr:FecR domain-containing protein [SAR324 cluster bacterium]
MWKISWNWKRLAQLRVLLLILFVLMGSNLLYAASQSEVIVVTHLENQAQYRTSNYADWESLEVGQELLPEYEIKTFPHTRMTMKLGEGSEVRVAPNTHMRINRQTNMGTGQIDLQLILGKAWAKFRKNLSRQAKLILRTAHAKINIHGTSYEATVSEDNTQVRVFTGEVAVSDNNQAAQTSNYAPREIAPPHEVSRENWQVIVSAFYTISVSKDQKPGPPQPFHLKSVQNEWIQWNQRRDSKADQDI